MIHLNDVFKQDLPIWQSSPALPWIRHDYPTKAKIRDTPSAVRQIRWFWHRIKSGEKIHPPDCCAFARSHICKIGENKVRAVWGYPATITFGEAVFALPLIRAYQKYKSPVAYGYETAVGGAKKIYHEFEMHPWKAAIDFSSFDKTVPEFLIRHAFDVLALNIDFIEYNEYGVADARRMFVMWDYIIDYFINTPIRLSTGIRFRKHSGVASGSYFTQLIDSVINHTLMLWITLSQTGRFPVKIKVFGDDSIIATETELDLEKANDLVSSIGMKINIDKSGTSRSVGELKFLGYKINNGFPVKEHNDWLAALCYPERPDKCWDDVATRALGLLHACSGMDTLFDHMCRGIICYRSFDISLSRSLARYLRYQGIDYRELTTKPPDLFQLARRLRVF